jgi:hypothetical protein
MQANEIAHIDKLGSFSVHIDISYPLNEGEIFAA